MRAKNKGQPNRKLLRNLDARRAAYHRLISSLPAGRERGYTCPGSMSGRK